MSKHPSRTVYCQNAIPWLKENTPLEGCSVVTSLPDISGLSHLSLDEWKEWFAEAAQLCLEATPDDGVTIFYQTDIKVGGTWVDKGYLCHRAAERSGAHMLWHKIVCRKPIDTPSFGRPGYTHLLCYSRGVRDRVEQSYADVFSTQGEMTWSRAMGRASCEFACKYILSHTKTRTVVDPFCGHGTMLAVANERGLDAIGVEMGKKRAQKARTLNFDLEG